MIPIAVAHNARDCYLHPMNDLSSSPRVRATTQAAEGWPRAKWTLAEFERLSELGFFGGIDGPRERIELIDGELVPMQSKGGRHEWVRVKLQSFLTRRLSAGLDVYGEPGWRPGGERYLEPEMIVCGAEHQPRDVPPADVLLLIEVSDSSLAFDAGPKAAIYSQLGIAEYWVIDANTLETRVHLGPGGLVYTSINLLKPDALLQPHRVDGLAFSLLDLGIPPA
jgi:Uma2 family endonuclease